MPMLLGDAAVRPNVDAGYALGFVHECMQAGAVRMTLRQWAPERALEAWCAAKPEWHM